MEIGRNLNFDDHVSLLSKKVEIILMKTFVEFQFGYCTLIWMFHSREANNKINNLQERSLRIVYDVYMFK